MTRIRMWQALCGLCLALLAMPATAANFTMADVLTGTAVPTTVTCRDMQAGWMRFDLNTEQGANPLHSLILLYQRFGEEDSTVSMNIPFFSKGDTVTCNGERYLIAYHPTIDETALFHAINEDDEETGMELVRNGSRVTPETSLALCLLNTRNTTLLKNVRLVDLAEVERDAAQLENEETEEE